MVSVELLKYKLNESKPTKLIQFVENIKNILFIINPFSGGGKGKKILPQIEKFLDTSIYKWDHIFTEFAAAIIPPYPVGIGLNRRVAP